MRNKYRPQRNYGCRIHDQYTYFGMRMVVLENEKVRIALLVDKGTEIIEYLYKPKDLDFMWLTENGVQNPNDYLPTSLDPIATFVDYYPGGWQEVFPNGGPTSTYLGAQFGQHGEVAHMPWDYEIVEDTESRVSVRFSVRTKRVPFLLSKTLTLESGSPSLEIEEQVENLSDIPLRFMWGQHLAFGKPFLEPGCRIILPDNLKRVTETTESLVVHPNNEYALLPQKGAPSEMVYLCGFSDQAWYRVENDAISMGIKVEWDAKVMPYLWHWQEYGATEGYPWYGRHYNIGLEPFTSYPTLGLNEAIRNGSAGHIGPKEKKSFQIRTTPYELD